MRTLHVIRVGTMEAVFLNLFHVEVVACLFVHILLDSQFRLFNFAHINVFVFE